MPPETDRPDYDQTLKLLLAQAPEGFVALVAPDLTWRAQLPTDLPAVARQADVVMEVEDNSGRRGLLHVELQTKVEPDLGERLAEYGIRLWRRDHVPVRSVVVCLRPARRLPSSPFVVAWGERRLLQYQFDVVRLWEEPQERVLASPNPALWPLASLMAGATVDTTVMVAERIASAPLSRVERGELSGLLWVLAGLRLSRTVLRSAVRRNQMIRDLWQESSFGALVRDEARKEGLKEGRQEGRQEGMRALAQVALEGRLGTLRADMVDALQTADDETLVAVMAHIASDSPEQVRQRLGLV